MADQTTLNATHHNEGVVGRVAGFGNDVFTLGELQAKLAAADLKECVEHAVTPLIAIVLGVALFLAALPVALLGAADVLARAASLTPGAAMLITAVVGMAVAGVVLFVFTKRFTHSLQPLRRSREELVRNLSWIRTVVVYSGRDVPKRKI